jgi:DNA-binding NtrC family response regulator
VIVDDNPRSLELLSSALKIEGLRIFTAEDPEEGLALIRQHHPQVVLTDLVMPKLTGMDVLQQTLEFDPTVDVILMTAHYSTESAVEAIRHGASDYVNKPVSISALRAKVSQLLDHHRRRLGLDIPGNDFEEFEGMVGQSPAMREMGLYIRRIAPHYRAVLVTGPTGTGKDLVARALHRLSPVSRTGRLVVLNCSAVVETLFESELFGHVKGSFTGATQDKPGLFEHADGGTLFLDEIGDMPMSTQAKLLRALQNQEILRVGSLTPRKVSVRVIAATHRDLQQSILDKTFREDLYYRLSMVEIRVPRLSERVEDLPLLIRTFLKKFSGQFGKRVTGLTRKAELALESHLWPGNVRELENAIGQACMMAVTDKIDISDLPEYLRGAPARAAAVTTSNGAVTLEEQEKHLILKALEQSNGNQSQAARILNVGRDALRYKMKKHGIQ